MPTNRCKTRKDIHKCWGSSKYTSYVKVSSNPLIIHNSDQNVLSNCQAPLPIMLRKVPCEQPITASLAIRPS
jgi:hypothetical protein